ncbi:dimeric dihydrodiol dehydrogenase [Xylogone sp. PMI_703]|nr:dimeric dihydrodiol dehydrogenase [Xylogone sp. PMI_703]
MALPTLRWGIIGTGLISSWFVEDLLILREDRNANHIIQAIGSSSLEKAKKFIQNHAKQACPSLYGSYDDVYNDPEVDIVYIGTPNAFHKDACLKAISYRKHVLCEKPFTLNTREAREVFKAAEEKGVFIMEAVWTRFMPLVRQLLDMVHTQKVIGEPQRVFCDFGLPINTEGLPDDSRLKNPALGAGSLLDIGIYTLTWGLLLLDEGIAEAAQTPEVFSAQTISHGIDVMTSTILFYPQTGCQGILTSTLKSKTDPIFSKIEGSLGTIKLEGAAASVLTRFTVTPWDTPEEAKVYEVPHKVGRGFFYEADAVAVDIAAGLVQNNIMPWEETLRVMRIMDGIRERGGARFPQDD